jgi:AcrR family transcriptional regulator
VERRQARTRARLLAAARTLFAARGVESTTISEIAAQADIAVGSFYNYFATRDELLGALLEEALTEQLSALQLRQAQVSDPAEMISVAHRHLVQLVTTDPDWAWLLVRLEVPHRITDAVLGEAARADLRAGIEAGRFRVSDPEVALTASGGALIAVMHSLLAGLLAGEVGSDHAEGVLRSFGLDPDEAAEIARRPLPAPGDPLGGDADKHDDR